MYNVDTVWSLVAGPLAYSWAKRKNILSSDRSMDPKSNQDFSSITALDVAAALHQCCCRFSMLILPFQRVSKQSYFHIVYVSRTAWYGSQRYLFPF